MRALPLPFSRAVRSYFPPGAEARQRGGILVRVLAGAGGGYAVAALFTAVLSLGLPMPPSEAVLAATMASFAVYAAAVVWAFAAPNAWRACTGLAAAAALLTAALFLLRGRLP